MLASMPSCTADPSGGRTAKATQGLNMVDGISTPLELSNDVNFVEVLVKTTENTLQYSKPPYKFAYACRSHDLVQPPLTPKY